MAKYKNMAMHLNVHVEPLFNTITSVTSLNNLTENRMKVQ
jgi:hypothetical protein